MLQQTGVQRVREKYRQFLRAFPSLRALAGAEYRDVLAVWKGLGYNRRAFSLKRTAEIIVAKHGGRVPRDVDTLAALPGIGKATACAVLAYAFNEPVAFIETNIRRVYIHFFFPGTGTVADSDILPLVEKTLDRRNPREWYDALMDYGTMLRSAESHPNRRGARYRRQPPFEGSVRQARGLILGTLLQAACSSESRLAAQTGVKADLLARALAQLVSEGFVVRGRGGYRITAGSPGR
ncbi:MAG: A/G-specific adenine glycosylase [Spirochaetes bacterium]|nr:A/G-specific adenine glycosylase [Spirochaetota bacterium]